MLDAFRAEARAWLEANAEQRRGADDWSNGPRTRAGTPSASTSSGVAPGNGPSSTAAGPGSRGPSSTAGAVARRPRRSRSTRSRPASTCRRASSRRRSRSSGRPCSPTARRSSAHATSVRSCAATRRGASCSASRVRGPTWRTCAPPRSATVTSSSSTVRRCGRRARATPTSRSCSCAPTSTRPSTAASRTLLVDMRSPASTCAPCGRSPVPRTSTRSS